MNTILNITEEQYAYILTFFTDENDFIEWLKMELSSEIERRAAKIASNNANALLVEAVLNARNSAGLA